ncbi:MAG: phosphoglucosamine mutase [Microthrixaceae bacterium]
MPSESQIRFGTDGVRGLANDSLTAEVALAIGKAAVLVLDARLVVIGRDTRRSGHMIEAAVSAGVCAEGANVQLLGVVPTPAVAAASVDAIGIMISASHNPFADNGIKIFAEGGAKLTDAQQQEIESVATDLLHSGTNPGPTGLDLGIVRGLDTTSGTEVSDVLVKGYKSSLVNSIEGRSLAGMRVVVDCANGSNHSIAPSVLGDLHAMVDPIGIEPDGININDGCGSTSPAALATRVLETGADLGIAFDGDADRLIAVDHLGDIVDGDQIIAICAKDLADRGQLNDRTVVVTVMSNLGFIKAMEAADIKVIQTGVGDRYVLEVLNKGGYSLGGEQSGHIIFRGSSTTGDGLLAAIQLLDVVNRSGRTLRECAQDSMTKLPQVLRNVTVKDPSAAVDILESAIKRAETDLGSSGRVLVRASGTEPKVRLMVEAPDEDDAIRIVDELQAELLARHTA